MTEIWAEYLDQIGAVVAILIAARVSLLVTWPGFLLLEKLSPVKTHTPLSNYWYNWKVTVTTMVLSPVFAAFVGVSMLMLTSYLALPSLQVSTAGISIGIPAIDIFLQGAIIFLMACILGDFSYYWWHRFQHTVPFLWELHKLHHSDENLNTTTIYRSHFLEPAGQAVFRGLSIGLIFDNSQVEQTVLAVVAGGLLPLFWDYFIHANVRFDRLHKLLPFFSTPQYHWIHHSSLPQHQDKNFAIWIPAYDKLFGSYYHPAVDEYPPTGLSSGEKIDTLWEAHFGPFFAWAKMLQGDRAAVPSAEQDG
jgi:sterol desaturase/sphingolipid hydroxylase (fatty acid hydroxylase superfamily)